MPAVMDNLTIVRDILDRMLPTADLQPLLDHLADDVALTVAAPHGGTPTPRKVAAKRPSSTTSRRWATCSPSGG